MDIKVNLISILATTGIFNSLFLSIFLFTKKSRNTISNRLLSLILLLFAIKIGYASLELQYWSAAYIYFFYTKISVTAYLCLAPSFVLYIRSLIDKDFRPDRKSVLFFLPALIYCFNPYENFFWENHGFFAVQTIFMGFSLLGGIELYQLWKSIKESNIIGNRKIFNWLLLLEMGMVLVWGTAFGSFLYELTAFYAVAVYLLIKIVIGDFKSITAGWQVKTSHHLAKTDLVIRLNVLMTTQKVYTDSSLTLPKLAQMLSVSLHALSREINAYYNQNFTEYINSYRIEEAGKLLASDSYDNYTIESIAFDCGFNSLSSFNAAFKKQMNSTPSQYRISRKKSLSVSYI